MPSRVIAIALGLLLATSVASAEIATFEGFPPNSLQPLDLVQDSIRISSLDSAQIFVYAGVGGWLTTQHGGLNAFSGTWTITFDGAPSFNLDSIEFGSLLALDTVTLTGYLSGGGTVTENFLVNPFPGAPTIAMPLLMQDVTAVDIDFTQSFLFFDNVTVTGVAVPEPTSLSLLLLAIGGLARRRRRAA